VLLASSCASQVPSTNRPDGSTPRPITSSGLDTLAPDETGLPTDTLEPSETQGPDTTDEPGQGDTTSPQPAESPGTGPASTPGSGPGPSSSPPTQSGGAGSGGIHKIKHVVVIMQENRSFDHYFGTFPGADGIPMKNGVPTVCAPNPRNHTCDKPYHDTGFVDGGGPHHAIDAKRAIDGGKMDGFIKAANRSNSHFCPLQGDPLCAPGKRVLDVMGYKTAREIPNYWAYAKQFVLQDHMFEPVASWSLPSHLYMVSAWSARCSDSNDPMSCRSELEEPIYVAHNTKAPPPYAWTDITYLLHKAGVSWRYYVSEGSQPDCPNEANTCTTLLPQTAATHEYWNPLPWFTDVRQNKQVRNVQGADKFFTAAAKGKLPAVSWIVPDGSHSEHPPQGTIDQGQAYVTSLVNAVMRSPDWSSTAIFISWDDWGGFYDHVVPPKVDSLGYGIRVPGILISPYAKKGYIDHQTLSFDAFLKFIEDDFLGGQRLDPATDGRPDSRPDVREDNPLLGDLQSEFDFTQKPRKPLILPQFP